MKIVLKQQAAPFNNHLEEVLKYVKSKYRIAVFTGTRIREKTETLEKNNLLHYFEHIFPLTEDLPKKPDPAPFRQVEETMGINTDEVLLIDDNLVRGVFSAKRRGWKICFLNATKYLDVNDIPEGLKPDFIIKDLDEIKKIL